MESWGALGALGVCGTVALLPVPHAPDTHTGQHRLRDDGNRSGAPDRTIREDRYELRRWYGDALRRSGPEREPRGQDETPYLLLSAQDLQFER